MQHVNVTICSPFRDSATGIVEYMNRVYALDYLFLNLRHVWVEGDSQDSTYDMLLGWHTDRDVLLKCDTGKPRYGSIVNAERFQVLAQVFNAALDAVDYNWSDYVLFLPSDIRYEPDLLKCLLAHGKDIISPFVWACFNGSLHFWDTWAFRLMGHSFSDFTPDDTNWQFGNEPIRMDTVGGVTLIKADVLKAGCRYTPDEVDRGLCKAAKEKGFTVWADPTTNVYHPPFAPEDQGLTALEKLASQPWEIVRRGIVNEFGFTPTERYCRAYAELVSKWVK